MTFGSRGDVQPYLALSLGLKAAGHDLVLAAPQNFARFVTEAGVGFFPLKTDVAHLLQSERGRTLTNASLPTRVRAYRTIFPAIVEALSRECWQAAQGAEALIYHAAIIAGPHIAEKLEIPAFVSFYVPTIRPTASFPHPSVVGRLPIGFNLGGVFNKLTYTLIRPFLTFPDPYSFRAVQNDFRERTLHLPPQGRRATPFAIHGKPIPLLYHFSPNVVPPASDWCGATTVTGYWFLPNKDEGKLPTALDDFLRAGPPPVYVGFGSMISDDPQQVGRTVIAALKLSGQRGILYTGGGAMAVENREESIFLVQEARHDWLFPRVSAVVHHGGLGTLMTALRFGKPNVVCSFSFDQAYWGKIVESLGVGPASISKKNMSATGLAHAIRMAVTDERLQAKAIVLKKKIEVEDGVRRAVAFIDDSLRQSVSRNHGSSDILGG